MDDALDQGRLGVATCVANVDNKGDPTVVENRLNANVSSQLLENDSQRDGVKDDAHDRSRRP